MRVEKSRRTALVLAALAFSAIALAPSVVAACPVHAKPMVRSIPRLHVMGSASRLHALHHHESCCVPPPRPRKAEVRRARPQRFPSSHAHRAWRGGVGGGGRLGTFAASWAR